MMGTHVRFLSLPAANVQVMDLKTITDAELTDYIAQMQAVENSARRNKLAAIAEYDRREAWKPDGATSMPSWLVGFLGFGRDTANEEVRVAKALEVLPAIAGLLNEGSLSWDQARAVTEFATPETDAHFAEEARKFSAPQLRRMARRFKPVSDVSAKEGINARTFKMWWDIEANMLRLKGALPGAEGALVEKAIDRIARQTAEDRPAAEGPYSYDTACADALVELASARITSDADKDRATIGVHVDAKVLAGAATSGVCELDHGQAIAFETARRLSCDSRWYIVVDGPDGLPIGIGRTSRQIPPWLAREIRHRDGGCRWVGCNRKGWINIHHLVHWARGGPTDMDNLVTLCGVHHRLVHEGKWTISGDPNRELTFIDPNGRVFAQGPHPLNKEIAPRVAALVGEADGPSP
jgi:hypothetical protein